MPNLGKNLLKLIFALLKHQVKNIFGEEALGVAAETLVEIGGEETQARLESIFGTNVGAEKLLKAAQQAEECFQRKCKDQDLRGAFTLRIYDLPSLQKAISKLPTTIDEDELLDTIRIDLKRHHQKRLTDTQIESGVNLYADCLRHALLPLKEFSLPIIWQGVLRNEEYLMKIGVDVQAIKTIVEELKETLIQNQPSDGTQWLRPSAPRPSKPMVGRTVEFDQVKNLLKPGRKTVITATVHGTPGVGKTILADHLAAELEAQFPGGVIFEHLGIEFRDPILCNPILKRWEEFAFSGRQPEENLQPNPDEVRALLARHGELLVVLDDVWDEKAITPLLCALPKDACLLVTTRSQRIAQELHGEVFPLDILTQDDALALLRSRVPSAGIKDIPVLERLAKELGCHAMALDIAGGSLARLSHERWPAAVEEMARQVQVGSGFGELHLPGDEENESRVEASLSFSYNEMSVEAKFRFRSLGVFAPGSTFQSEAAASIWQCTLEQAEDQLSVFVELNMLICQEQPIQGVRWKQHTLLRAYALALLHRTGEEETARKSHAEIYNTLIGKADDSQSYYLMLDEYSQIRHAFSWAIEHDLYLAQSLASNTANLQAAFYLVRENHDWARRLVKESQKKDQGNLGPSVVTLANALGLMANLPGEDRRARLLEALGAYDEALKYYRPDTAPLAYAMTQNNRGNVLRDLAASPGEDRSTRLLEALGAYDEALKFCCPDTAPLEYAMTQRNLGLLYVDLSSLLGENRKDHLREAMKCTFTALTIFIQKEHEPYAEQASRQLKWISEQTGTMFVDLWKELELGDIPEWLE